MIDIIFVTYNSERWLDNCVASIAASDFDLKQVTLTFSDNASKDGTITKLTALKEKYGQQFADFRIQKNKKNLGFGAGNNAAAKLGSGDLIFGLNTDTTVYPDTLAKLAEDYAASPASVGLWELRQFPYEHPKFYDPLTRETSWSSGACFAVRRELWEKIGGFDENIFMYGEDVDLSWRVRAEGYTLRYVPKAVVNHYCYQSAGEIKPTQFIYSLVYNLYLRNKFGADEVVARWDSELQPVLNAPEPFPDAHARLLKALKEAEPMFKKARRWHEENLAKLEGKEFRFLGFDYENIRDGAFYENERPTGDKKVSVIVRTCGRPSTLRETLISLRGQTYPNIEVVVVEDGPNVSEKMIRSEFADLNVVYQATGEKAGRSAAGNLALSLATGDYMNFLDDDDLFFADHVESLVMELQRHPEVHIAYSLAYDTPIRVISREPYKYELTTYNGTIKKQFNRIELLHHNLFPIQAVMFERQVYEEFGGLDVTMDALEDWDLWVRYATKYEFRALWKTTSVYRVPADRKVDAKRQKELDDALKATREKHTHYQLHWNSGDLVKDYEAICTDPTQKIIRVVDGQPAPAAVVVHSRAYRIVYGAARKCYHAARKCYGWARIIKHKIIK